MFPLHDDNPTRDASVVVYALIVLNVLIFFHQSSLSRLELQDWLNHWAVIPRQLTSQFDREFFTLISSQFLHADLIHLVGNMWFLFIFGNNVEERLGSWLFLPFYLVCGIVAIFAQVAFAPYSAVPMVGASGAIAGVMGAYIVKFPRAKILTLVFLGFFFTFVQIPAVVFLGFWILGQTIYATLANPNQPGVAYLAHVGGFVAGMVLLALLPTRDTDYPEEEDDSY
jgi:membrane associated rhomboid family serine protease